MAVTEKAQLADLAVVGTTEPPKGCSLSLSSRPAATARIGDLRENADAFVFARVPALVLDATEITLFRTEPYSVPEPISVVIEEAGVSFVAALWPIYDSTFRDSVLPTLVRDRDSSLTQVQTEVADYVDNHPGADECDIAQALQLPLLQVYHITRELENRAVLRRGHNG